eukprot:SAG31_NODE_3513_length_4171_cov_2.135527_4_plen_178_part_00
MNAQAPTVVDVTIGHYTDQRAGVATVNRVLRQPPPDGIDYPIILNQGLVVTGYYNSLGKFTPLRRIQNKQRFLLFLSNDLRVLHGAHDNRFELDDSGTVCTSSMSAGGKWMPLSLVTDVINGTQKLPIDNPWDPDVDAILSGASGDMRKSAEASKLQSCDPDHEIRSEDLQAQNPRE